MDNYDGFGSCQYFFSGTEYASCCDRYWTTVYDIDGIASCFEYSDESININSGVLYGALCTSCCAIAKKAWNEDGDHAAGSNRP